MNDVSVRDPMAIGHELADCQKTIGNELADCFLAMNLASTVCVLLLTRPIDRLRLWQDCSHDRPLRSILITNDFGQITRFVKIYSVILQVCSVISAQGSK